MAKIKDALRNRHIQGFLCESIGTVETIAEKDRAAYRSKKLSQVQTPIKNLGDGNVSSDRI